MIIKNSAIGKMMIVNQSKEKKNKCKTRIIDKIEYKIGRKMEIKLKKIAIAKSIKGMAAEEWFQKLHLLILTAYVNGTL